MMTRPSTCDYEALHCRDDLKWGVSIWSSRAHSVRVRDTLGEWQIGNHTHLTR